jgi:hypothetical protein
MMKFEEYKMQIEEGRRRKREENEPNIYWIVPKVVEYRRPTNWQEVHKAIAVGAYLNDPDAQYIYRAYHIIDNETGARDTIPAQWVIKSYKA